MKNTKSYRGFFATLVKDERYSISYLPNSVYAEIREASVCRDQIMKRHRIV